MNISHSGEQPGDRTNNYSISIDRNTAVRKRRKSFPFRGVDPIRKLLLKFWLFIKNLPVPKLHKFPNLPKSKPLYLGIIVMIFVWGFVFVYIFLLDKEEAVPTDTIQEYFDESVKTGNFSFEELLEDGRGGEGKFWVKDRQFRIEQENDEGSSEYLISPDGNMAYVCYEDEDRCERASASVDYYLLRWNKPSDRIQEMGTDDDYSCLRYRYVVDKLYNITGAANPYYANDILYCIDGDTLIYREHKGNNIEGGQMQDESVTRYYLDDINLGADIDADKFELPYEISDGK